MFIVSNNEKDNIKENRYMVNRPINTKYIMSLDISSDGYRNTPQYIIEFTMLGGEKINWMYDSKEERDKEYEWIMKQIGYVVNDEAKNKLGKPPKPVERPGFNTNYNA